MSTINITFLGTASAQPSRTRNHSSLALRLNGYVWLFDCGESTQHQIQKGAVKMGRISKVFITHTHGTLSAGSQYPSGKVSDLDFQATISLGYYHYLQVASTGLGG
jgi:glyoxylase-like metal-dependent hydrolase (beta-lactamase superfamily II)